jgi:hypothetical protein
LKEVSDKKEAGITLPLYDRPPSAGLTGKKITTKLSSFFIFSIDLNQFQWRY